MELKNHQKNIILISSGQPSLNPRLVKEADTLVDAGYNVKVLYAYWNDWGTKLDAALIPSKKWKAIRIGGDPQQKPLTYFLSRLIAKAARFVIQQTGFYHYLAELAASRSSYFLMREARKHKADLYIAHNIGALPATVRTALWYKKPCGFDAEDFHRQEVTDDINSFHFKISSYLEDKYLPSVNYLTASSPLIAQRYTLFYKREVTTILNVFSKTSLQTIINNDKNIPLKLFWFSQVVGANRGLETILEAMGLTKNACELHLLGHVTADYKTCLVQQVQTTNKLYFYEPVRPDDISHFAAKFDVGLASETGFCLNSSIALSNKLFTYIQSGLAIVATNTTAQSEFIHQYPLIGKTYDSAKGLSYILDKYNEGRELLFQTKKASFAIGQAQLNWENEREKFLNIIKNVLGSNEDKLTPKMVDAGI